MVGDITNGYLSMKECSGVAWHGLLKVENVTKTVSKLNKAFACPDRCEIRDVTNVIC